MAPLVSQLSVLGKRKAASNTSEAAGGSGSVASPPDHPVHSADGLHSPSSIPPPQSTPPLLPFTPLHQMSMNVDTQFPPVSCPLPTSSHTPALGVVSVIDDPIHDVSLVKDSAITMGKDGEPPRTGRACLACRKLKTRCDGADEPPCKRCRQGGHDCIFVESKRGKRPAKKSPSGDLVEKFKHVEQALNMVIQSMNSGQPPDLNTVQSLQRMQQALSGDVKAASASIAGAQARESELHPSRSKSKTQSLGLVISATSPSSASSESRHSPIHSKTASGSLTTPVSPTSNSHEKRRALTTIPHVSPTPISSHGVGLNLLADASLAAELGGTKGISGLDASFNLSKVTEALEVPPDSPRGSLDTPGDHKTSKSGLGPPESGAEPVTPSLLTKGIIDADTAVELFRIFFDYCYIHLPLLDPTHNTAPAVCTRSPFLFTVICAVASRFHSDPNLHTSCYDEAHAAFINMIATGERSIDSIQACMTLTVWTSAPKTATDDRPQQAWLYHGMAVRIAMEMGLFRPPSFCELLPIRNGQLHGSYPWGALKGVPESVQRDALNRERTWLLLFVIDRYVSAVMGRPYQIHEVRPLLIPTHPLSLPFDLGIIAHQELQSIVGQVMDTFRDRIYGLPAASNEMPSPVVMKLFNGRMDEWRARWCPKPGEPISNNLLFYWYNSKLFLNTFPLQTMLRSGNAADDPQCVSICISSAKEIFHLVNKYHGLGVLRHCPDFNLLVLLYAGVFLLKVKVSESRFSQLIASDELVKLLSQGISDCQGAMISVKHAAGTASTMLRALLASWRRMEENALNAPNASTNTHQSRVGAAPARVDSDPQSRRTSDDVTAPLYTQRSSLSSPSQSLQSPGTNLTSAFGSNNAGQSSFTSPSLTVELTPASTMTTSQEEPFLSQAVIGNASIALPSSSSEPFDQRLPTYHPGAFSGFIPHPFTNPFSSSSSSQYQTPSLPPSQYSSTSLPQLHPHQQFTSTTTCPISRPQTPVVQDPLDSFLNDTQFFNSVLVSQGSDGFFSWQGGMDSAGMMDLDNFNPSTT